MDDLQHHGLIHDPSSVNVHQQAYGHQLSSPALQPQQHPLSLQPQQAGQQQQHAASASSSSSASQQQQHGYQQISGGQFGQHSLQLDPSLQHQSGHPAGNGGLGPSQGGQLHQSSHGVGGGDIGAGGSQSDGGGQQQSQQPQPGGKKKRAPPTRWFAADDAAMVRVLLEEKRLGHETEHGFLTSSWDKVVAAVQETTLQGQKKDIQPCKDRYKLMIRTLYQPFKELMMHPDFHWSDQDQRFHATADAWSKQIEINPFAARYKSHSFPLFQEFEELVGYRRQAQLGQLLHLHELAGHGSHGQVNAVGSSSHSSPGQTAHPVQQGTGGQGGYGEMGGMGMGAMEESFMRVDDGDENGLMGSVLDETYAQSSLPPPPPMHPLSSLKRPYAAVTTTSLANSAAGGPSKRPYLGSSHPSLSTGPVHGGSSASHATGLAALDPALHALEHAHTLSEINAQLKELMVLVRRGVEVGEKVLAALPQSVLSAAAMSDEQQGSTSDLGNCGGRSPDRSASGSSAQDQAHGDHRVNDELLAQGTSDNGQPDPNSTSSRGDPQQQQQQQQPDQVQALIAASPYLSLDQKAVLTERAAWDHEFAHDLLATTVGDDDGGHSTESEDVRRQLYQNALDAGAI